MGCWGFGLKQSDDALDWESLLYEAAGLEQFPEDGDDLDPAAVSTRAKLEATLPALLEQCKGNRAEEKLPFWNAVGYQVLSCILMEAGCAISKAVRQQLIAGATSCQEYRHAKVVDKLVTDAGKTGHERLSMAAGALKQLGYEPGPWGIESLVERMEGRLAAIDGLVDALNAYGIAGGKTHVIYEAGLLEKIVTRNGAPESATLH